MQIRRAELFPQATDAQWRDWRWQLRNSLRSPEELERAVRLTEDERRGVEKTAGIFRLGISPYYLSLIDRDHPFCPVRMQAIPVQADAVAPEGELRDPLADDLHRPVRALAHKYPDSILLLGLDPSSASSPPSPRRR